MKIINWEQYFLYTTEQYQLLREYSLLVLGMSYIVLRGCWCDIIVEEEKWWFKNHFYKELEQVFDHFPKYNMTIIFGDLNAKVGKENIFKLTTGNKESTLV